MAIKLVARMSFKDDATGPMRRLQKQMNNTERASTRLSRSMQESSSKFDRFGKGIGGVTGGIGRLASKLNPVALGIGAIGSAAAGAYGAVKLFNATVGEAAKMQQSQVVIGAMFDDKKLSDSYMKMMDKIAVKSPLLDSQAMYGNSKSFVALSKNTKDLEKMWSLTERLVASDPTQGLEGAVFALRELFSGDAVSIIDRFEMDKTLMNQIKKLPLEKQMAQMDKYMNKMGFTTELIDKMGNTAIGKWTQAKEKFQLVLRDMGEPALKSVSNFLNKALDRLDGQDMKKFGEWGGKVINSMVTGLSNSSIKLYDWFTRLINDPEFKSRTTLTGKINFVVDDIGARLHAWYDNGGKKSIMDFGSNVAQVMVAALDSTDEVFVLGTNLGKSIWSGVQSGIRKSAEESPIGKAIIKFTDSSWGLGGNRIEGIEKGLLNKHTINATKNSDGGTGVKRSWKSGIDRVPSDGLAMIHKDETVLNPVEAKAYRSSLGKGGNGGINITVQNLNVREESDIEKVAMALAKLIEREGGQMGNLAY